MLLLPILVLVSVQAPDPKPTSTISVGRQLRSDLPLDQQIAALQKAARWIELADLFESMGPQDRGLRLGIWLEALKKAQRWSRLEAILDAAIPQMEAKGIRALPERLLRASALDRQERRPEALAAYLEAGEFGAPLGYLMAGNLAVALRNDDALGQAAAGLCERTPNLAQGWAWKGEVLFRRGLFPEAEPLFEKAAALDPKEPATWTNLAACRNARKAYAEAIEASDRALALASGFVEAHFNRGLAHFGLKRYADGRADMANALAQDPADPMIRSRIEENLRLADRFLKTATSKPAPAR